MCGAMTTRKKKNREDTRTERGIDMTNEEFAAFGIKNCEIRKYEF